jgi:hypothetical protein
MHRFSSDLDSESDKRSCQNWQSMALSEDNRSINPTERKVRVKAETTKDVKAVKKMEKMGLVVSFYLSGHKVDTALIITTMRNSATVILLPIFMGVAFEDRLFVLPTRSWLAMACYLGALISSWIAMGFLFNRREDTR